MDFEPDEELLEEEELLPDPLLPPLFLAYTSEPRKSEPANRTLKTAHNTLALMACLPRSHHHRHNQAEISRVFGAEED
ncbi:MAG: hypothetical protein ABSG91_11230, partial [Syntrophobacteraceae bacterium]